MNIVGMDTLNGIHCSFAAERDMVDIAVPEELNNTLRDMLTGSSNDQTMESDGYSKEHVLHMLENPDELITDKDGYVRYMELQHIEIDHWHTEEMYAVFAAPVVMAIYLKEHDTALKLLDAGYSIEPYKLFMCMSGNVQVSYVFNYDAKVSNFEFVMGLSDTPKNIIGKLFEELAYLKECGLIPKEKDWTGNVREKALMGNIFNYINSYYRFLIGISGEHIYDNYDDTGSNTIKCINRLSAAIKGIKESSLKGLSIINNIFIYNRLLRQRSIVNDESISDILCSDGRIDEAAGKSLVTWEDAVLETKTARKDINNRSGKYRYRVEYDNAVDDLYIALIEYDYYHKLNNHGMLDDSGVSSVEYLLADYCGYYGHMLLKPNVIKSLDMIFSKEKKLQAMLLVYTYCLYVVCPEHAPAASAVYCDKMIDHMLRLDIDADAIMDEALCWWDNQDKLRELRLKLHISKIKDIRDKYYERKHAVITPFILDGSRPGQREYLNRAMEIISRADVLSDVDISLLSFLKAVDKVINYSANKYCHENLANIIKKDNIELMAYCMTAGLISKRDVAADIEICNNVGSTRIIPYLLAYGG